MKPWRKDAAGAVVGRFLDIDERGHLRERSSHALLWDHSGRILAMEPYLAVREHLPAHTLHVSGDGFVVPGAVDCHLHYPQTRIIGGFGSDLLDWLTAHVWPEESRFRDDSYATIVAREFLRSMVSQGTTTAMVFGSQFKGAMSSLFELAEQLGMCLFSGLVGQDRETLPIVERTTTDVVADTHALIDAWHGKGRLRYTLMPRFSLSCSPEMLRAFGEIFQSDDTLYMQTHINESTHEIDRVMSLFPRHRDYLDTYEAFGLVGPRASFAHSVHTSEEELQRMLLRQCSVVHCPSSNGFLGSGAFPYYQHQALGIPIGVGTDVGAGLSFSMWKEMGHAHLIQMRLDPSERHLWTGERILKAMTRDGAQALHMQDEVGSLDPGKWADFVWVKPQEASYLSLHKASNSSLPTEHLLFRYATSHENDLIAKTWIQGNVVFERSDETLAFHSALVDPA